MTYSTRDLKQIDGRTVTVRKSAASSPVVRIDNRVKPKRKTAAQILAAMSPEQLAGVRYVEAGFEAKRLRAAAQQYEKAAAQEFSYRGSNAFDFARASAFARAALDLRSRADKLMKSV